MRSRVVVRDDAARELPEARSFYENRRRGYGDEFADAVEQAFRLIAEYPRVGKLRGKTRRLTLADWPYAIVYMPLDDALVIIALAHHSRRPGYWRRRLR